MASELTTLDSEAARYVESHRLEEHLSAAVDQAIQKRSGNPLEVIIEHLQKVLANGGVGPSPVRSAANGHAGPSRNARSGLDLHMKARSQDNPDYPKRLPVTDEAVRWSNAWPSYSPPDWTAPIVFKNARDAEGGHGWADPADVTSMRVELNQRITYTSEGGAAATFGQALNFDSLGRPINPVGRTGLAGRGLLGKWGSNHAADPIVTRFHPTSGQLQVVAIQRKDTGQWAIPGGMVDAGESVSVTVKREFKEEVGNISDPAERASFERDISTLFEHGKQVYRGYVDDPRATDHAWMETTAFHFHCSPEVARRLPLEAGDDAAKVQWLDVTMSNPQYRDLYASHRAMVDDAVWGAWARGELNAAIVDSSRRL